MFHQSPTLRCLAVGNVILSVTVLTTALASHYFFYTGAIAIGSGLFGDGLVTAGVTGVECTGEEMTLSECELEHIPISGSCDQDAEIICRGNDTL